MTRGNTASVKALLADRLGSLKPRGRVQQPTKLSNAELNAFEAERKRVARAQLKKQSQAFDQLMQDLARFLRGFTRAAPWCLVALHGLLCPDPSTH